MFMVMGPHTALGNIPRSIEYNVDWVTGVIRHMRDNGLSRAECTPAGVADWTDHVKALGESLLSKRDRQLDDRDQPQRRGQDGAGRGAVLGQRASVPGAVPCGGGRWASGDAADVTYAELD